MKKQAILFVLTIIWLSPIGALSLRPQKGLRLISSETTDATKVVRRSQLKSVPPKEDQENLNKKLVEAANWEHWDEVKKLVAKGADINYQDPWGHTALHEAAYWFNPDMVKFLLENGANKNIRDEKGRTPLDAIKNHAWAYKDLSDQQLIEETIALLKEQ